MHKLNTFRSISSELSNIARNDIINRMQIYEKTMAIKIMPLLSCLVIYFKGPLPTNPYIPRAKSLSGS